MPTKIVSTKSNPQSGEINQLDLRRIIQDFENFADIKSSISREFKKMHTVSIPVKILEHLMEPLTALERESSNIQIHFGITLPDQKDCTDGKTDVSNHLTVALMLDVNGVDLKDQPGDFVITPGFKEFSVGGAGNGVCCPVIHPSTND